MPTNITYDQSALESFGVTQVILDGEVVGYAKDGVLFITDKEAIESIRDKVLSHVPSYPPKLPRRRLVPFFPNSVNEFDKGIPALKSDSSPQRNDLCPCNSGKKFKKCCLNKPKGTQ